MKKLKSASDFSINLHPKGVGNGYDHYRGFSREIICKTVGGRVVEKLVTMGYVSNFRNSGEEAILIHGTKTGKVALYSHFVADREEFSVKDFISHIKNAHGIDLNKKNKGPLHILSCFGVSNGVYQAFSNELGRHVIGYGDGNAITTTGSLIDYFNEATSPINSAIGDVEADKPEDITFMKASVHRYVPHLSKY
jgi:hypothetical protein